MPLLEVENLSVAFGGLAALAHVSLGVERGEIVGLIGPNGAGKTTLFNAITGFVRPTGGEIRFKAVPITGWPSHRICWSGIARTFQLVRLLPELTVLDNVLVAGSFGHRSAGRMSRAEAGRLLERLGLGPRAQARAHTLPLADRKRLELARALATEPTLLLLDEVMAGLNATEIDTMVRLVGAINASGVSVLLIEHNMRAVMSLSHRIVVLSFGEKIAEGPPRVVAADRRVIEAYLGEEYVHPAPP
jgi:branched-chain amino acid transport system ATP-binding protein